jgi:hypothetical protein
MERASRTTAPRARDRLGSAWLVAAVVIAVIVVAGFVLRALL